MCHFGTTETIKIARANTNIIIHSTKERERERERERDERGNYTCDLPQVHHDFSFFLLSSILCVSLFILASALDVPALMSSIITEKG